MANTKYFKKIEKATIILLLITLLANLILSLKSAFYLRPAADDYILGAIVGEHGIIGGLIYWWNIWSGFVYPMFIETVLVGWPLIHLPWSIASAIPFVSNTLLVGFLTLYASRANFAFFRKIIFISFASFMWLMFLWCGYYLGDNYTNRVFLGFGITHWQTLNGGYALPFQLLILAWIYLLKRKHYGILNKTAALFIGLLSGTLGSAASLGIFIFGMGVITLIKTFRIEAKYQQLSMWFLLSLGTLIGVMISHLLSPGQQLRQAILAPNLQFSFQRFLELITFTVPFSLQFIITNYINAGTILVLTTTALVSFLYAPYFSLNKNIIGKASLVLLTFALILTLTNRLSEAFSYVAFWHYTDVLICIFLSSFFTGLWIGAHLSPRTNSSIIRLIMYVVLLYCFTFSTKVNLKTYKSIYKRNIAWYHGSAPISAIADIEAKDWNNAWIKLNGIRKKPIDRK